MLNSIVGYSPPQTRKICKKCDQPMDWTENAGILLNGKASNWNWGSQHNGDCLKIYSQKVKEKVVSGSRCHNPRCSGSDPTFLWEKNGKLYCSVECFDGYKEWNDEVSHLSHSQPHRPPEMVSVTMDTILMN